jgi:hypothetical protein
MTRTAHDRFAKQLMEDLLSPFGLVELSREILGETRQADVWFAPHPEVGIEQPALGVLGQMVSDSCLLEPYRNAVQPNDVRDCLSKLFDLQAELRRRAKRHKTKLSALPRLWIVTPTASQQLLEGFSATLRGGWTDGIYFLGEGLLSALVVINKLPLSPATLWLRLMGRGTVQTQAIAELIALPANHPFKRRTLEHLVGLQINLQSRQNRSKDERELVMNLTPVYQQWREETLQEGREAGRQEGRQEARLQMLTVTVPLLLKTGMTVEEIAEQLQVDIEAVRQAASSST